MLMILSFWMMGICQNTTTTPLGYYRVSYYSRYVRVIQNKTYATGSDVKVASHGTLTVGTNTTISNGAKVRFASDGAMNIGSGFTVQSGAIFTAETW